MVANEIKKVSFELDFHSIIFICLLLIRNSNFITTNNKS